MRHRLLRRRRGRRVRRPDRPRARRAAGWYQSGGQLASLAQLGLSSDPSTISATAAARAASSWSPCWSRYSMNTPIASPATGQPAGQYRHPRRAVNAKRGRQPSPLLWPPGLKALPRKPHAVPPNGQESGCRVAAVATVGVGASPSQQPGWRQYRHRRIGLLPTRSWPRRPPDPEQPRSAHHVTNASGPRRPPRGGRSPARLRSSTWP
jgi:hypothetical protein